MLRNKVKEFGQRCLLGSSLDLLLCALCIFSSISLFPLYALCVFAVHAPLLPVSLALLVVLDGLQGRASCSLAKVRPCRDSTGERAMRWREARQQNAPRMLMSARPGSTNKIMKKTAATKGRSNVVERKVWRCPNLYDCFAPTTIQVPQQSPITAESGKIILGCQAQHRKRSITLCRPMNKPTVSFCSHTRDTDTVT